MCHNLKCLRRVQETFIAHTLLPIMTQSHSILAIPSELTITENKETLRSTLIFSWVSFHISTPWETICLSTISAEATVLHSGSHSNGHLNRAGNITMRVNAHWPGLLIGRVTDGGPNYGLCEIVIQTKLELPLVEAYFVAIG